MWYLLFQVRCYCEGSWLFTRSCAVEKCTKWHSIHCVQRWIFFEGNNDTLAVMPIQFVVHDNIYVEFKSLILPNHVGRMFQFLLELLHWYVRKNSQYVAACVKFSNLLYYRPNIWFALVSLFINKKLEFQNVHNLEWFIKENLSNSTHYFIIFPSDCIVLYYYLCASKIIRHVLSSDRLLLIW